MSLGLPVDGSLLRLLLRCDGSWQVKARVCVNISHRPSLKKCTLGQVVHLLAFLLFGFLLLVRRSRFTSVASHACFVKNGNVIIKLLWQLCDQ